jgi:hypothetical protein
MEEINNDTQIVIEKEAKLWCTVCESFIVSSNNQKNIKQHLKSITHKKSRKSTSKKHVVTEKRHSVEEQGEFECILCTWTDQNCFHPLDPKNSTPFDTVGWLK